MTRRLRLHGQRVGRDRQRQRVAARNRRRGDSDGPAGIASDDDRTHRTTHLEPEEIVTATPDAIEIGPALDPL